MSFSRREFMQVLAVASAGGMALDHKDVLAGKAGCGAGPVRLAQVWQRQLSALHRLPRAAHADPLPRTQCEPGRGRSARPAAPSGGRAPAQAFQDPPWHARGPRLHLPQLREGRQDLRQGRWFCPPGHAGQADEGQPPLRHAARRWRHLAGQCDRAVDQWPGHGRRLQAAGRQRHEPALGIHPGRRARQGNHRERLRRPSSISWRKTSRPTISATRSSSPT